LRVNDLRNTIIAEDRPAIHAEFDAIAATRSNRIAAIRPRMIVVQMIRGRSKRFRDSAFGSGSKTVYFKYKAKIK
jgi:hypothetical protein